MNWEEITKRTNANIPPEYAMDPPLRKAYEKGAKNSFNMEDFEKKYWWEVEQKLLFPAEYAMNEVLHRAYAKGAEVSYRIQKEMVEDDRK